MADSNNNNTNDQFLKVHEYFTATDESLACRCCGTFPSTGMSPQLIYLLNCMSTVIGYKVTVTSGYRCESHNIKCGGVTNSQHVLGTASDIAQPDGWSLAQLYRLAAKYGVKGTGGYVNDCFIHVDMRYSELSEPITWGEFPNTNASTDAENRLNKAKAGQMPEQLSAPNGLGGEKSSNVSGFKTSGNLVITIKPEGKTFCEPIYPDLLSLPGTVPASVIDAGAAVTNASGITTGMEYVVSAQDNSKMSGLNISNFVNTDEIGNRQKVYNAENDKFTFKTPNVGAPLNCCDPYPVDLKIEELENHMPRVKQHKISLSKPDGNAVTLAKEVLKVADTAEKRIVKLENILSTVMRYCFGMGRRMQINCLYYGGQDHRSKYKCIRCKRDDMTGDGQIMQIDQCLACTRYEPFFGQTYDILNETGANLAAIQDINQASMMNMQEYSKFTRTNEYQEALNKRTFDATRNQVKEPTDTPFDYNTNNNGSGS